MKKYSINHHMSIIVTKIKKQNAIERVSIAMDTEESPASSAHDISLKITNLKTYYCSTKAKYESAMKSGAGVDDIPTIPVAVLQNAFVFRRQHYA